MKPIHTNTTNCIAGAEGYEDLPLTRFVGGYETCWKLSEEELKEVQKTGKIYISILSDIIPPMAVETETTLMIEGDADGS